MWFVLITVSVYSQQSEILTYYVNGKAKTANVSYAGLRQAAYSLDQGGNIVQSSSAKFVDDNTWSDWQNDGIIQKRVQGVDSPGAIYGFLSVRFDFYSAVEQNVDGNKLIFIYTKNTNDEFIWFEGNYVYVLQKVYVVNSGNSSGGASGSKQNKSIIQKGLDWLQGKGSSSNSQNTPNKEDLAKEHSNRGSEYLVAGDYDRAIYEYTEAIRYRSIGQYTYFRGLAYYRKGQYDLAIVDFTKTLSFNDSFIDVAYYFRGNAYYDKGQYDKAIADFTKAIQIRPGYYEAERNLERAKKAAGR